MYQLAKIIDNFFLGHPAFQQGIEESLNMLLERWDNWNAIMRDNASFAGQHA